MDIATKQCTYQLRAPYKGTTYEAQLVRNQSYSHSSMLTFSKIGRHTIGKEISESARHYVIRNIS